VFSLTDLANLYETFAVHDPRIKQFVEKIVEQVQTSDHEPFQNFQLHEIVDSEFGSARLAVIAFDTE